MFSTFKRYVVLCWAVRFIQLFRLCFTPTTIELLHLIFLSFIFVSHFFLLLKLRNDEREREQERVEQWIEVTLSALLLWLWLYRREYTHNLSSIESQVESTVIHGPHLKHCK